MTTQRALRRWSGAAWLVALLWLALAAVAGKASAQASIVLAREPSCKACTITLVKVATLGGPRSRPWGEWIAPKVTSVGGRYYVAPTGDPGVVETYDSAGRPLPSLGRWGQGPGEFLSARWVLPGPGDSISVVDDVAHRWSIFSPQNRFIRSVPIMGVAMQGALVLSDGGLLLQGVAYTPAQAGYILHPLDHSGAWRTSFGTDRPVLDPRETTAAYLREITVGSHGRIWSARPNHYEVEAWSSNGRFLFRLERHPSWFVDWEWNLGKGSQSEITLRTGIMAIREDASGLLWVFLTVPRKAGERIRLPDPAPGAGEGTPIPYLELFEHYRSVVEVIDPERRELIASVTMNSIFFTGQSANFLFYPRLSADSREVIDVWRAELKRR